ncbi:probable glycosyltransferase At5g03795 isoform X2 [Hibiscus syriacus]|uniref:probable glycosyltransferase At5g03795 isoform X2 n=1 Tax=Hibiscus syriacus TaxID=106335 RepID=UPI001920CC80|nr:probable glycosyltransferase At5g03795 isoform X2 [Hibiscus syriacus]
MGIEELKNWLASTSSSSSKILLCLVPLVLVSGFASLLLQKGSNLGLLYTSSSSHTVKNSSLLVAKERDSPIDSQVRHFQTGKDENKPDMAISGNLNNSSIKANESTDNTVKPRRRRIRSSLVRVEEGLRKARLAIREAPNGTRLKDPDYIPDGPIYNNAKAFHRSYLEMEKRLKIFVYEEGELPLFHDGPCRLLYTMEGQFINKMEVNHKFRTHNPHKAHLFYLPYSVTRLVQYNWVKGTHMNNLGTIVLDYVNLIATKHPFWNRSHGADHFMLSCHDWGPATSFYVPGLVKSSIRALCNANTSERFNPMRDVSIPEISLKSDRLEGLIGGLSPSKRSILAFFAGGNHGFVRPILFDHWEKKDPDIQVHSYLPRSVSYYDQMRQSKYCLCPSGYEVASPRIVEALYNGCVPVLISKTYVPPFSDVLNWKSFAVIVSLEEIPDLKKILMGIPERKYIRMQKRVIQVRRHFELYVNPKRFDVFHMILHSIWLRRLNVRVSNDPGEILLD